MNKETKEGSLDHELIMFPPKKDIWDMKVGDTYGFNCQGKHWTITMDEDKEEETTEGDRMQEQEEKESEHLNSQYESTLEGHGHE